MLVTRGVPFGLEKANKAIPGTILVGRAEGRLDDLVLHEVEILDDFGVRAIYIEKVELEWGLLDLLMRRIAVDRLIVTNPEIYVRLRGPVDGVNLATAFVDKGKKKKKKKKRDGPPPLLLSLRGSADFISVTGAKVIVETARGTTPVDLRGLDIEAVWSMERLIHDIQLTKLDLDVVKPLPLAGVEVTGGVVLTPDLTLDLSDLSVDWRAARLHLEGTLGQLKDITPRVDLTIEHLDLVDIKEIAAKAPLEGTLDGRIAIAGRLKEELRFSGALAVADGSSIELRDVRLRLPGGDREVIEHDADLKLVGLSPEYFITGVQGLPTDLDLELQWTGQGTKLDTLKGELLASGQPFEYQQMTIGPLEVDAVLDGPIITTRSIDVGFGGGELHVSGTTDVRQQSFALDVDGTIANLGALRGVTQGLVQGGAFNFDGFTRGVWGGDGPYPLSIYSRMETTVSQLRLEPVSIGAARTTFEIDMDVVPGGVPRLRGTLETSADRIATPTADGMQEQVRAVIAGLILEGSSTRFTVRSTRGADIVADSTGLVDWGALPKVTIRADSLEVMAGEYPIEAMKPFEVTLESGALDLTGLELTAAGGTIQLDVSRDPRSGEIATTLVVRSLDLAEMEPIGSVLAGRGLRPFDHVLVGLAEELTVEVEGTLASPIIKVTAAIPRVTALGRPQQAVELELNVLEGHIEGRLEVEDLMTLTLNRVPIDVSLDGRGPVAQIDPEAVWDVKLEVHDNDLQTIAELAQIELPELVEGGTYKGTFAFEGTSARPTARTRVRVTGLQLADRAVTVTLGAELKDGQLELQGSKIKADGSTVLEFTGGAGAPVGEMLLARLGPVQERHKDPIPFLTDLQLGVEIRTVPMSLVHVFVGALKPLTGALGGHIGITGELNAPEVKANVTLEGARAGKQDLFPIRFTAGLKEDLLTSDMMIRPKRGGRLRVETSVPFPLHLQPLTPMAELFGQDDLEVKLTGDGFPMPVLLAFVPDIWESAGTLTIDGGVTGSIRNPVPNIGLKIDGGLVCYKRTAVCYEDLSLDTRIEPELVSLTNFSFETVPQVVNPVDLIRQPRVQGQRQGFTMTGSAVLDGMSLGELSFDLNFDRMWAAYTKEFKVQVHSPRPLTIRGTLPALTIDGHLELQNVDINLGQDDVARGAIQRLTLPANLRVHRENTPYRPGEQVVLVFDEDAEPSFGQRFAKESSLSLKVTLTNNVHVKLNVGIAALTGDTTEAGQVADMFGNLKPDLALEGEVEITLQDGALNLEGEILTGRGSELTVLTKKFTVALESSLKFVGQLGNTQLGVTAIHPSNYGDVRVVVTKKLSKPQIDFESDELEDQADIMSVLITGKPLSELGSSEGKAASSIIARGLAGFLTGMFGKYIPLDSLDVEIGDDGLNSFSVEAGKAITPYIFFLARYNHGAEDDENRVEGQLEIRLDRRAYVEFRIGDRLDGAAEVVGKVIF